MAVHAVVPLYVVAISEILAIGVLIPVITLYMFENGISQTAFCYCRTVAGISGCIGILWSSWVSDYVGRKPMLALACLGEAGCYLALGSVQSTTATFVIYALSGIAGNAKPIAFSMLSELTVPDSRPFYFGLLSGCFGVAMIVGPLAGGWISNASSLRTVVYLASGLQAFAGLVSIAFQKETLGSKTAQEGSCGSQSVTENDEQQSIVGVEDCADGRRQSAAADASEESGVPLLHPGLTPEGNNKSSWTINFFPASPQAKPNQCNAANDGSGSRSRSRWQSIVDVVKRSSALSKSASVMLLPPETMDNPKGILQGRAFWTAVLGITASRFMKKVTEESLTCRYTFLARDQYPSLETSWVVGRVMSMTGVMLVLTQGIFFAPLCSLSGPFGASYIALLGLGGGILIVYLTSFLQLLPHMFLVGITYTVGYGLAESSLPMVVATVVDSSRQGLAQGVLGTGNTAGKVAASVMYGTLTSVDKKWTYIAAAAAAFLGIVPLGFAHLASRSTRCKDSAELNDAAKKQRPGWRKLARVVLLYSSLVVFGFGVASLLCGHWVSWRRWLSVF